MPGKKTTPGGGDGSTRRAVRATRCRRGGGVLPRTIDVKKKAGKKTGVSAAKKNIVQEGLNFPWAQRHKRGG